MITEQAVIGRLREVAKETTLADLTLDPKQTMTQEIVVNAMCMKLFSAVQALIEKQKDKTRVIQTPRNFTTTVVSVAKVWAKENLSKQ